MNLEKQAFTLVELIVVVTILAVLATIGFVSYSGYLAGTRDTNRVSNIKALSDGLELYRTKHSLPLPEDYIEVKSNGTVIAYQGYVGQNVLETIEFSNGGKDPKYDTYFSYYLTKDKKYFQLMGYLEEQDNLQTKLLKQTEADTPNYSVLYPTVYGKRLGILTDTTNTPIQEVTSIKSSGEIDISTTTNEYIARLDDARDVLQGTGVVLSILEDVALYGGKLPKSCLELFNGGKSSGDGNYNIYLDYNKLQVYCDMTTDGGGYTFYKVTSGIDTYRSTDDNTCKQLGMDIVVPRNSQHFQSIIDFSGNNITYVGILGVTKPTNGGDYRSVAMNSDTAPDRKALDGGKWWFRDTPHTEPSGDYTANCRLSVGSISDINNITFNDASCTIHSTNYICSTNDK